MRTALHLVLARIFITGVFKRFDLPGPRLKEEEVPWATHKDSFTWAVRSGPPCQFFRRT